MTDGEATGGARLVGWIVRERLYAPAGPAGAVLYRVCGEDWPASELPDVCVPIYALPDGRYRRLVRRRPVGWEQRVSAVLGLRRPASGAGVVGSGGVHGGHPAVPVVRESVCGFAVFGGYRRASV